MLKTIIEIVAVICVFFSMIPVLYIVRRGTTPEEREAEDQAQLECLREYREKKLQKAKEKQEARLKKLAEGK